MLTFLLTPLRAPLRRLLAWWTDLRLVEPAPHMLDYGHDTPIIYVFPKPALTDTLLLETFCRRHGLPLPSARLHLGSHSLKCSLALSPSKRRLWRGSPRKRAPFAEIVSLLETAPHAGQELRLVPVSVFWGRAPGKTFGLRKLLAADSWQFTGRLQRLLSVLVNGKNVELYLGDPLSLRELIDGRTPELVSRKVSRLLRVHFRRIRTRVLGPDLSHRHTLIQGVVSSPEIQRAIAEGAASSKVSPGRMERRAGRYGREIASNMSYPVLRFLDQLLHRLWNQLYGGVRVQGLERAKALAGDHTLIYVPCHRSHIDYLLLSYVLYREGLMPPHVAAGRNLDMPLVGPLLRRGGAFFLRRSFKDNRLYSAVFNEYLHRLLSRGHPVEYFIEGGRSRSGRLLAPRPGMLSMTLRSYRRGTQRELAFVPVYIGYEKVLESASYLKELQGGRKKKESPFDLFRVLGQLRQPFGRVAVNVGEPLKLGEFLDASAPGWRRDQAPRPSWLNPTVTSLGRTLGQRINAVAALNAVNLVALVLLATSHRAIEARLLKAQTALLVDLLRHGPGDTTLNLPEGEPGEWIDETEWLGFIERRDQALGELILANQQQATLLTWYRNNVLHLFALPALVAFAFRNNARFERATLHELLAPAWPLVSRELFASLPMDFASALDETLDTLARQGLLLHQGETWSRPPGHDANSERLHLLGRLIQPSLERDYLLLTTLLRYPSGSLTRESLEEHSRQLAERLTLLSGLNAPEFFDRPLFSGLLDVLEEQGWLWQEQERLCFNDALEVAQLRRRSLFDPALRHRLQQITRQPDEGLAVT
ncbi:glycerol-3-phosphate acyltransferase [Modicisalibacter ilicicola DSM 19980]|uniref:Glycerol-3-phosphate acyltransferase n=1 Tax=Modicisalibacter ilicicola DSM 19980 TaxID=1121942 RepID=A0A1M4UMI0_9GAMM|nr:glycerol-3-phosphate 1-O-acyltransferase PlsB [Halomonas ilicicola]SHE57865.1 glycerol-3-phosphate acyltransferase [Halomonas ilicicola DSM 19980]